MNHHYTSILHYWYFVFQFALQSGYHLWVGGLSRLSFDWGLSLWLAGTLWIAFWILVFRTLVKPTADHRHLYVDTEAVRFFIFNCFVHLFFFFKAVFVYKMFLFCLTDSCAHFISNHMQVNLEATNGHVVCNWLFWRPHNEPLPDSNLSYSRKWGMRGENRENKYESWSEQMLAKGWDQDFHDQDGEAKMGWTLAAAMLLDIGCCYALAQAHSCTQQSLLCTDG